MPTSRIIGSGPAAAGVALALPRCDQSQKIIVVDIGGFPWKRIVDAYPGLCRFARAEPEWPDDAIDTIAYHPVVERRRALPEKWTYGSIFHSETSVNWTA